MDETKLNKKFGMKVYDGKVGDTNYKYTPSVSIFENTEMPDGEGGAFVASVHLVSVGYSGNEAGRARTERNARLLVLAPELEAMLISICSIPALAQIEERNSKLRSDGANMLTDALALLAEIRGS